MNRKETTEEKPKHYSRDFPPDTLAQALARIDEVIGQINNIEAQLKYTKLEDHPTEDAYCKWKRKAGKALRHLQSEFDFLDEWLFDKEAVPVLCQALTRAQKEGFILRQNELEILAQFNLDEAPA